MSHRVFFLFLAHFEEKAAYLISRFVKEEKLVEQVMEGLRKAGMKV
jgi:hypothetical protein